MIPKTPENYRLFAMYILKERLQDLFSCYENFSPNNLNHIANIAASVMMTRDNVLIGGGFANAIVKNDLYGAFSRADSIIIKSIQFMVYVMNHVSFPEDHPIFETIETNWFTHDIKCMEELTSREIELLNLLIDTKQRSKTDDVAASEIPSIKRTLLNETGFSKYVQIMKEIQILLSWFVFVFDWLLIVFFV